MFTRFLLIMCSGMLLAQEEPKQPSLYTSAPEGWRAEVIPFPLGFAPDIPLKGVEELRFAPGMFKPESEEFYGYSFIWWLDGKVAIDTSMLEINLKRYYVGLYNAVSKKETKDTSSFKFSVNATREPAWPAHAEKNYRAEVHWIDPCSSETAVHM